MAKRVQILRGLKSQLVSLLVGEFGFCTDTKELFLGNGSANDQVVLYREITGKITMSASDVDFTKPVQFKTLTAATTLTFSNLKENRAVTLVVSGNYALTLPSSVKKITGTYDGTKTNLIQFLCVNADTGSLQVWCVISQETT